MGKFLKTVNVAQWITVVLIPGLISAVQLLLAPGPLRDAIVALVGAVGGQVIVSVRTPSVDGGTTKTA